MKMEVTSLEELCSYFEASTKSLATKNQYTPIVRDALIPFLKEKKGIPNNWDEIESTLKYNISKEDLIEGTYFYIVNNENIVSETAVENYIIAFNQFFKFLFDNNIENTNYLRLKSDKLYPEIKQNVLERLKENGRILIPPQKDPPIEEDEFEFILKYCNQDSKNSYKDIETRIIIKLFLMYGIKPDKMYATLNEQFINKYGILEIKSSSDYIYSIQLPPKLADSIRDFQEMKNNKFGVDTKYLFVNSKGKKLENTFLTEILKDLRQKYRKEMRLDESTEDIEKNKFTQTGLIKFAIIQMIEKGINQSVIQDFTNVGKEIFNDCQHFINSKKNSYRNRYLNSKLRSIETFDLL